MFLGVICNIYFVADVVEHHATYTHEKINHLKAFQIVFEQIKLEKNGRLHPKFNIIYKNSDQLHLLV